MMNLSIAIGNAATEEHALYKWNLIISLILSFFNFGRECAAGTSNTPTIHIISRLTKHTYSNNLYVKRYPIHIIEEY